MLVEIENEILELLKPVNFLSLSQICSKTGLSRRHAKRYMDSLYYQKKINTTGSPRCFNYYLKGEING